ncbi:hypothetical protein [Trichormus sp. NMC-1]|uniref:hypothetical protein n=1 Tax=Trichormus sp. NMC-1 TaxID=1853259 RepID=UPI0008DBE938|nr:hypothetical protein [Trichormus sp. NMC-1]
MPVKIPNQDYKWKRFWYPRSQSDSINLACGGYLCDPEAEWGRFYNPHLVTFEAISDFPCLALLGEPGIGKSRVLETSISKIQQQGSQVLYLDLRSFGDENRLVQELFNSQKFNQWLKGTHKLHIFLDSFDECLLRIDTLATLLVDKFKDYRNKIQRLNLRIACRAAVWPVVLEKGLKDIWGEDNVEIYKLASLRSIDVSQAARIEGINDIENFLQEIKNRNLVLLAIQPITLKFLFHTYHNYNNQFPSEERLHKLYFEGCRWLCDEWNPNRISSKKLKGTLTSKERLIIAARLAAITIFCNKFVISVGFRSDVTDDALLIEEICQGTESIDGREIEIKQETIEEVLGTSLFSSRDGLSRIGWAHQTYAEFLAAWYLVHHEIPLHQAMKLIFVPEDAENKLTPKLHETASWLASMRNDVLQEIIKTDPDVLLRSDIPTDEHIREAIVDNLLKQYEQEKLIDLDGDNYQRYEKLKHSNLSRQLRPYIQDSSKSIHARDVAIDIAEVCDVHELQEELVNLVLDFSQPIYLRVSAAKAISKLGNASTRLQLKPLVFKQLLEDEYDQLKGYVLRGLWPDNLTAEELFNNITTPKKSNFTGAYRIFLDYELVLKLQSRNLVVALNWVAKQGLRCTGHPFERLANEILLKACQHWELPNIVENFTKIALIQWREYQKVITIDNELKNQFKISIINDVHSRHKLIKQAVQIVAKSNIDPYFLVSCLKKENIFLKEDIFWMLNEYCSSISQALRKTWVILIDWNYNRNNKEEKKAIIKIAKNDDFFRNHIKSYTLKTKIIFLNRYLLNLYIKIQNLFKNTFKYFIKILDLPRKKILALLKQVESEEILAWWQIIQEMHFNSDSQSYEQDFESDLTKLFGWQKANTKTRERIINAAKKYIELYNQLNNIFINTGIFQYPESSGFKALLLLLIENPEKLKTLPSDVWQRWTPVIVCYPYNSEKEQYYTKLAKWAYMKAPSETLNTLLSIINRENNKDNPILTFNRFQECWDERFKATVLDKAKDTAIKPQCLSQLLEELLKHESNEARKFAQSLISIPLPIEEKEYQKAIFAAKELVGCTEPVSWEIVWSAIQQDTNFGREVFEEVANRYSHGVYLPITEKHLADLYIWLVQQYPHAEDIDHSNEVIAHFVGVRESIAGFRDSVLTQLRETGTSQACMEIERITEQFPSLTWLKRTLLSAKKVMRRITWQPLQPEQILQIVNKKELHKTILILASNSVNKTELRLDKEMREIQAALRRSQKQNQFKLEQILAVRTSDLRRSLLDFNPQIVHFCGHGSGDEGLVLQDEDGQPKLISTDALVNLFKECAEHVECVIFNAYYSEVQAKEIVKYSDYVIGMSDTLADSAAIEFAQGFYDALGAGNSIESAYNMGCNAIQLKNIPQHLTPKLFKKQSS